MTFANIQPLNHTYMHTYIHTDRQTVLFYPKVAPTLVERQTLIGGHQQELNTTRTTCVFGLVQTRKTLLAPST